MAQRIAATPDEIATPETALSMPGIAFVKGMRDGIVPLPPICGPLNFGIHSVARGEVVFGGTPTFDCLGPIGATHGGWYAALLDSAMTSAVMTCLEQGQGTTTLEFKLNMVRPVPLGTETRVSARIQHVGRRSAVAVAEMTGRTDGKLYATASTTCIVL